MKKALIIGIALVVGYLAYVQIYERRQYNKILETCSDYAQTWEQGEQCRENYRENIGQ